MRGLVVAACLMTGCLQPSLVDCGDGTSCPAGSRCDALHTTCVSPEQDAVCIGQIPFTPCTTSVFNGACYDEVCLPAGCGNGQPDPGEVCDDGNVANDDVCSSDCLSDLTCGTGAVDEVKGETCDDGNRASHDGCDSNCRSETEAWSILPFAPFEVGQGGSGFSMANNGYDSTRSRLVVAAQRAVWEFDGESWSLASGFAPGPTSSIGATYEDTERQQVVAVFVDFNGAAYLVPWTGTAWGETIAVVSVPANAIVVTATYDTSSHQAIIVARHGQIAIGWAVSSSGGVTDLVPIGMSLFEPELGYDPERDEVILLGFDVNSGSTRAFTLAATSWTPVLPPDAIYVAWHTTVVGGHLRAYDQRTWQAVERSAAAWIPVNDPPPPFAGDYGVMSSPPGSSGLQFVAGFRHWHLSPAGWSAHAAPDATTIVAIDGAFRTIGSGNVWKLTPRSYALVETVGSPPPSYQPVCAYSVGRAATVCATSGATVILAGASWQVLEIATGPQDPTAMAYDPVRRRVVAVEPGFTHFLDDEATAWVTSDESCGGPISSLAYDARNGSLIGVCASDPYELIDDDWREVPIGPNGPRVAVGDERRGTAVFFPTQDTTIWERIDDAWVPRGELPDEVTVRSAAYSRETGTIVAIAGAFGGLIALVGQHASATPFEDCTDGADNDLDGADDETDDDCYWLRGECPPFATCP